MAPKVNIKKINLSVDKKETNIEITGGVIPWMLSWIEGLLQSYLIDYILSELLKELQTDFLDDLNQLALKYLQRVYIADKIGLDLSLNEKPNDVNGTYMLDLNGTFMLEDPQTNERNYAALSGKRIGLADFQDKMDTDVAFALKVETIDSILKLLWSANKTINIGEMIKYFDPTYELLCDNPAIQDFPNMKFDTTCRDDNKYPVSIEISIPTEP